MQVHTLFCHPTYFELANTLVIQRKNTIADALHNLRITHKR